MNKTIISLLILLVPLHTMAEAVTDSVDVARNSIFDPPQEEQVFFYHKDHLGSTLCITDRNGQIVERSEYIPYGEVFIDNFASDAEYETPYKFTGKEYDDETGLYYYGARYLHPKYATWLSVDPLATKYPNVSPYVYCHGNPISWIDPDGKDDYKMDKWGYLTFWRKTDGTTDKIYAPNGKNMSVSKAISTSLMNKDYAIGTKNMDRLFLFVADNTDVEWRLVGYETDKGKKYSLATSHDDSGVLADNNLGEMNEKDMTFTVHNHPGYYKEDQEPSGFDPENQADYKKGDCRVAINTTNRFEHNYKRNPPKFYVYFPKRHTLIRYNSEKILSKKNVNGELKF